MDASPDPDGQDVAGNFDLSGLIERISYAIRKYKAKRVAIDSITAVFQQYDAIYVVRREIFRLIARLKEIGVTTCLLYTSPSPRDISGSRMPSSA